MLGAPKSALVFITAASPFLIGAVHPERPPPVERRRHRGCRCPRRTAFDLMTRKLASPPTQREFALIRAHEGTTIFTIKPGFTRGHNLGGGRGGGII